jgi:Tol biopolymer transport system component
MPSPFSFNSSRETNTADSRALIAPLGENSELKKLCFMRDNEVYVRELLTGQEKRALAKRVVDIQSDGTELRVNYSPSLSPLGDTIAFQYRESLSDARGTVKTLNLNSQEIREFPELTGVSTSEPEWSQNGRLIAFKLSKGQILHVGVLDVASGKWRDITAAPEFDRDFGVWLDGWAPDDKSIVCHNSEFLYRLGVDGSVLFKLPIESFYDPSSVSTSTRFSFTADGTRVLFDSGDPDDAAILVYDLNRKSFSRISPQNIDGIEPRWLPGEKEVLFTCMDKDKRPREYNICKIGVDGTGLTKLVDNGRYASYSAN